MRHLRALPTLIRVGFAEAVAYRAEMLVWVFATTMPLVMLTLWSAVAQGAPVVGVRGTWTSTTFVAYFLSVFIVRQLISSWACWEINFEVRQGTLGMRLLRPIHPIVSFAMQNIAYWPMRGVVTMPVAIVLIWTGAASLLSSDPVIWLLWALAVLGGWMITFFANIAIGAMSLFMENSIKLMDLWLAAFFVFSGYLIPIDVFPPWLAAVLDWLPFRYQIGLPVELMMAVHTPAVALSLLARQWVWAGGLFGLALLIWQRGIRRFQAFGG